MRNLLKIGDKVKIRSLKWFEFNSEENISSTPDIGRFKSHMKRYCGLEATIVDNLELDNSFILDVDNKLYIWQDYMLDSIYLYSRYVDMVCNKLCSGGSCNNNFCKFYNFQLDRQSILNVGDKVMIRSYDWFDRNKISPNVSYIPSIGRFSYTMSLYCSKEATIVNKFVKSDQIIYKLNIDNEKWEWQDYMFDMISFMKSRFKEFCKFYCIYYKCKHCFE